MLRVGIGGVTGDQEDRRRAVDARDDRGIGEPVAYVCEITAAHRHVTSRHGDRQRAKRLDRRRAAADPDRALLGTAREPAARHGLFLLRDRAFEVEHGRAERRHRLRPRLDRDPANELARSDGAADAGGRTQRGENRPFRQLRERGGREHGRRDRLLEDRRLRGIVARDQRRNQVGRHHRARRVDSLLDLRARDVDRNPETKPHGDARGAVLRGSGDPIDARDAVEPVLDRLDDEPFDLRRRGARIRCRDGDDPERDRRQHAAAHAREREQPCEPDEGVEERDDDRIAQAKAREAHAYGFRRTERVRCPQTHRFSAR